MALLDYNYYEQKGVSVSQLYISHGYDTVGDPFLSFVVQR